MEQHQGVNQQQQEENALQVTAPIISCLKNELDELPTSRKLIEPCVIGNEEFFKFEQQLVSSTERGDGFVAVISLHDANTLYVSSGISHALGYPQDMLVGQSIMGFLYPKDRLTFANLLSRGLQSRFSHASESAIDSDGRFVFYVRIREYKGLKNCGFEVVGKQASCKPFQLRCFIRDVASIERMNVPESSHESSELQPRLDLLTICFVIIAIPLHSAHKLSEERNPAMVPFSTRHTSSCHFSYVDHSSISFLGYFPQDIIGFSIFNFYHEDDFAILKETYHSVSNDASHSIRGRPVRFRVFNGDYVILETEWSSFVNPWTRKIEFIIGNHRIIQGPVDINVFDGVKKPRDEATISPDSKVIQDEIIDFLSKPVSRTMLNQITNETSGVKRKRKLVAHVNDIIEGRAVSGKDWSDKYSVVLGAVSPHLESSDSSSNTPPHFQEERFKDNIERFFASQPQTNCETCSSSGSSLQNNETSPDRTRSNDGSGSSDPKKCHSSVDSAFQSGSNEESGNGNGTKNTDLESRQLVEYEGMSLMQSRQQLDYEGMSLDFAESGADGTTKDKHGKMSSEEVVHRCHTHLESLKNVRKLTEEALTYHNKVIRHKHQPKMGRNVSSGSVINQTVSQGGEMSCSQRDAKRMECSQRGRVCHQQEGEMSCSQRDVKRMECSQRGRPCHQQEGGGSSHPRRSPVKKHVHRAAGPSVDGTQPGKRTECAGSYGREGSGMVPSTTLFPPPYSMVLPTNWLPQPPPNLCSTCSSNFLRPDQLQQSSQVMLPVLCALPISFSSTSASSPLSTSFPRNGFSSSANKEHGNQHHDPATQEEFLAQRRSARIRTDFATVCRKLFPSGYDDRQNGKTAAMDSEDKEDPHHCHSLPGERESTGFSFSTSSSSMLPSSSDSPNRYPEFLDEKKREEQNLVQVTESRKRVRNVLETPAWIKNVNYTDDLIYRYRMDPHPTASMDGDRVEQKSSLIAQQLQLLDEEDTTSSESCDQTQNNELPDDEI